MKFIKFSILFFCVVLLTTGCETYKNIPYFQDLPDSARVTLLNAPYKQLIIQSDDVLNITIQTIDPSANSIFNQNLNSSLSGGNPITSVSSQVALSSNPQAQSGYLVDKNGDVAIPIIGIVKLAGLTTDQARDLIEQKVLLYYKLPTVNVRFANLKITVLGEVLRPGTYILPNEKNTIFDVLGLAGDLTVFGKRENALIIRDSMGKSQLIRFNLNSTNLIQKDYFYLKQNDVVYIEPNKSKIASLDAVKTRNFTILASVLSILLVLATRVK